MPAQPPGSANLSPAISVELGTSQHGWLVSNPPKLRRVSPCSERTGSACTALARRAFSFDGAVTDGDRFAISHHVPGRDLCLLPEEAHGVKRRHLTLAHGLGCLIRLSLSLIHISEPTRLG